MDKNWIGVGALAVGLTASMAMADDGSVRSLAIDAHRSQGVHVITRDVAAPAATIDRALGEQPVRPYLTEVKLVTQTLYLDASANYLHQDGAEGSLDENHWILRAQRLALATAKQGATSVQVFYGSPRARTDIQPRMILLKPPMLRNPAPGPQQIQIPTVPRTPDPKAMPQKVAQAP